MVKKLNDPAQNAMNKRTRMLFLLVIVLYTFVLYGNTLKNRYSLDDYIIQGMETSIQEDGFKAIGEIFTTTYTTVSSVDGLEKSYGYRPVVRLVFALEYYIFGVKPGVSHFINILLYLAVVLVLFRILQRIFKGYSYWFPFVIILLFIAHPIHTEVVASLKNRDELLSMMFALLTLQMLLKYSDRSKTAYLVYGLIFYGLAILSKPTAFAFWFVYPLTLYFFTDLKWKKILSVFGMITLMIVLAGAIPLWLLDRVRNVSMVDNPLFFEDNFWNILGTSFYSLGYYFRLLVVPFPLLYFYGYDMIPVVNLANGWVWLSIVLHIAVLGVAIYKFREKHAIAYAILFYLFTIAMFSNIVKPAVGIVAERFAFIPSIGFTIALAWLIFMLFKANPGVSGIKKSRVFAVVAFTILILIPYTLITVNRNRDWFSEESLYRADMKYLDKSVKAHDLLGTTIMRKVEMELSKRVNVAKFLMPDIREAIGHFKRATEIYPGHTSSWINMGMIYNNPRIAEHLLAKGDTSEFLHYKRSAISSFSRAIELEPHDGKALFNLGFSYENMGKVDSALYYYERCISYNPQIINPRSRLANLMFMQGKIDEALEYNRQIMYIDPNEALPYLNFGNYYMMMGDTIKAITNFEEAALRNARPELYAFLAQYYTDKGNMAKAREYNEKYNAALRSQ